MFNNFILLNKSNIEKIKYYKLNLKINKLIKFKKSYQII